MEKNIKWTTYTLQIKKVLVIKFNKNKYILVNKFLNLYTTGIIKNGFKIN